VTSFVDVYEDAIHVKSMW